MAKSAPSLSFGHSLLGAALIEAGLLLVAGVLLAHAAAPEHNQQEPVRLAFDEPVLEKPHLEPKPEPKREAKVKLKLAPTPPQPRQQAAVPPPVAQQTSDSPLAQPAPPEPLSASPSSVSSIDKAEADFSAKLKAAIQAALVYPSAAKTMGIQGQAKVGFLFRDGFTSQVHIVQSSGNGMIDRAALLAVSNAAFPILPDSLRGKEKQYQVTVNFDLATERSG